jgi:hypothetical protein
MLNAVKIFNSILILLSLYMAVKHGWGALSGKPETLEMFAKWDIGRNGVRIFGFVVLLSGALLLFPKTFLLGNFLTSAGVLFITMLYLQQRDLKGVLIELPFLLMPWLILYLGYPFTNAVK